VRSFSLYISDAFLIFNLSLSRRFSLLRSVGDPVLVDQLRSRLADQRTRGAENQISEEEEEMFLDTLERMRPKNAQITSQDTTDEGDTTRNSIKSSPSSSVSSSPGSRSAKRYSNNLFGSGGRLRDYTYLKNVTSSRGSTSSGAHTTSLTLTETSEKTVSLSSFRPVTPDGSSNPSSVQSSPNENGSIRSTPVVPSSPSGEQQFQAMTVAEYRLHKTLGPSVLKRASMALDEAIREIEDEVEDEILLPRSVPAPRGSLDHPTAEVVRPYFYFRTVNKNP
jgi:serine/arginine repetitive matrix protein 2